MAIRYKTTKKRVQLRRRKILNEYEKRILEVLIREGDHMTTTHISKEAKISWNTAFKYLKKFEDKGWVDLVTSGVVKYWKALVEGEENV